MTDATHIRFMLDSFMHFHPAEGLDDFVRQCVGKWVMLFPTDGNPYDPNCVEGFIDGKLCCHVSARKAELVRAAIQATGQPMMMTRVAGCNLDSQFKTAFCIIELENPLETDIRSQRMQQYGQWTYDGPMAPRGKKLRALMANTLFLLSRLKAPDTTEEELLPVIQAYLQELPMCFAQEDKEMSIEVNLLLQQSDLPRVREKSAELVQALDYLNHPEVREQNVREWMDELRKSQVCLHEAEAMTDEVLAAREAQLAQFPGNLYEMVGRDFGVFCGNLFYNLIPRTKLQHFMSGVVACQMAHELRRGAVVERDAQQGGEGTAKYPFVINQQIAEDVVSKILAYMEGKTQPRDVMMPVCAAVVAGVIRRVTYDEMQRAFPDHCPRSKSSVSQYLKNDAYQDPVFQEMVNDFKRFA